MLQLMRQFVPVTDEYRGQRFFVRDARRSAGFTYLKLGLAVVLAFVGVKMLLTDIYKIPVWTSLGIIAAILAIAMVLAWRKTRGGDGPSAGVKSDEPRNDADQLIQ